MICNLRGGYHVTHTYRQAKNVDNYVELGHYIPFFVQNGANLDNSYAYGWNNQCAYSGSSCSYYYQPKCVQYESKSS